MNILKLLPLIIASAQAQEIQYDQDSTKDLPVEIEADNSIICNEHQGQCVATGNAVAIRGSFRVNADTLILHFKTVNKKQETTHLSAHGHVVMSTPNEKAYGDDAVYDLGTEKLKLTGSNLKLVTKDQILEAKDSLEYWRGTQQGFAIGEAVAIFPARKQIVEVRQTHRPIPYSSRAIKP